MQSSDGMLWNVIIVVLLSLTLSACTAPLPTTEILDGVQIGLIASSDTLEPRLALLSWEGNTSSLHLTDLKMTCPSFAPGYRSYAYTREGHLHIVNLAAQEEEVVEPDYFGLGSPQWSPNGEFIAVTGLRTKQDPVRIWLFDVQNTRWQPLDCPVSTSVFGTPGWCHHPAWLSEQVLGYAVEQHRDQSLVEFWPAAIDAQISEVPMIFEDLSAGLQTTSFRDVGSHAAAWSPDGSRLGFVGRPDGSSQDKLMTLDVDTEKLRQFHIGRRVPSSLAWIDDQYLAFVASSVPAYAEGAYPMEKSSYEAHNVGIANVETGRTAWLTTYEPPHELVLGCPVVLRSQALEQLGLANMSE